MANGPFFEYYASVVEILDKNGQTHGVGSIIDDSHVITCAHVVGMCLVGNPDAPSLGLSGRKIQVRRSYVNGRNSEPHEAEVELYFSREENSASADLALLRLSKEQFAIGGNCRLASFSDALVSRGEIVFATGFPDDAVGTRGGAAEAEYRAGGPQPNLWISLTDTRGFGEEIRPGFSGAPVWSESAKANVGLITEADNTRRTATLIPTTLIKSVAALPISGGQPLENRNHGDVNAFHRPSSRLGPFRTCMEFLIPSLHYFLTARLAFFHDPPERDIFARYLRNSAAELYERMKEKTYIPSIAAEPPETAPLLWRGGNFANPIQQLIRELAGQSAGGDSASAEISAISKRSHRVRRLIGTLMRSDDPLILLGEPGSGKSLTLQQAMMLLSYQNIRRVQPTICLYFSLGRLTPVSQPNIHTIESFVRSSSPQEIRPYLEFLENAGRLVLIFDGMDEMSRELYIDHTAALSAYAESRRGVIRTLFSCRIADFSPNFRHRRLLLLPFDIDHVYLYIRRQFGANAIDVDGQLIKPKALARLLLSDEITIQAGNPFILWLLCLYIHENHHIPQNRVALLKHYYHYMYSMKSKERGNADLLSRSVDEVFDMWGEIALEITNRNQGSEIPLQDVNLKLGPKATIALAAGRACGSLQQSFGDSTPKVRFEHHRAQEFFAARALLRASADFNWTDKLDIPRWQETLVNVALMGGGGEALQVLKASLENVPEILNSRDGTFEHFMSENLVAERVEVGARIAREMSAVEERNDLWSHLQRSVQRLLESGDPASKVKMLRLIQRNPSQFSTSDLTAVLNHPSVWVRDQANTVATRLSTQIARSPLPMELLYSFTTGTLPLRLRSFLKMAREVQRPAIYVVCLCGLFLMMAQACAFGTIDIVLAHAQESVFSDLLSVDTLIGRIVRARWYFPAFYAVVVVSVLVSAIKFAPRSWLIVPAVGLLIIGAPLGLQVLWTSDDLSLFGTSGWPWP